MRVSDQIQALFHRHGQPHEDHALTVSLLVLVATQQERLLSTQADLQTEVGNLTNALSSLASGITSLVQKTSTPATAPIMDQTTLDSVVATLNSAAGQIANLSSEIQTALNPPATPAPAAPAA